jgi:hypothetical protein
MTIEELFIAAEKGGFETYLGPGTERFKVYDKSEIEIDLKTYVLDPLFWQALGEGLGWKQFQCRECLHQFHKSGMIVCPRCNKYGHQYAWLFQWHRFIDELAEDKLRKTTLKPCPKTKSSLYSII